jgi:sec-independent protein translocase protein TatC
MAEPEEELDDKKMPLLEHLVELRRRLIRAFIAIFFGFALCFYFANQIFDFLMHPLAAIWAGQPGDHQLIFTALQEKFITNIKVGLFGGFILAFPVVAYQLWGFVAPGLYKNERRAFLPFLFAAPVMFALGAVFVYYALIPNAFRFFTSFEEVAHDGALAITAEPRVSEYLGLIMQLIIGFGLAFELPVILTLLVRAGIIEAASLRKARRYAYLGVTVVSAILTPPDALSMLAMAVPLVLLFEVSIVLGAIIERGANRRRAAEEAAEKAAEKAGGAASVP